MFGLGFFRTVQRDYIKANSANWTGTLINFECYWQSCFLFQVCENDPARCLAMINSRICWMGGRRVLLNMEWVAARNSFWGRNLMEWLKDLFPNLKSEKKTSVMNLLRRLSSLRSEYSQLKFSTLLLIYSCLCESPYTGIYYCYKLLAVFSILLAVNLFGDDQPLSKLLFSIFKIWNLSYPFQYVVTGIQADAFSWKEENSSHISWCESTKHS